MYIKMILEIAEIFPELELKILENIIDLLLTLDAEIKVKGRKIILSKSNN